MHDTMIEGLKFSLDHFDRYENTCFLSGWLLSTNHEIESLRVEIPGQLTQETGAFEIRPDVNKFYDLSDITCTGFKFILTPEQAFSALNFSVKFTHIDQYQFITEIENPRKEDVLDTPEMAPMLPEIGINNPFPSLLIVDNFYDDPDKVREYALSQTYTINTAGYKGARSDEKTIFPNTKAFLEGILHKRITQWEEQLHNGVFQYCIAEDPLVYCAENQAYAAAVFLTPEAPPECGTSFYRSKYNGLMRVPTESDVKKLSKSTDELLQEMFAGNVYDKTRWERVDTVGNVYNRMIIWDARKIHAASAYFGDSIENSHLSHVFFFDAE